MKENTKQFYIEAINKAILYIETHITEPIYIGDVAQSAHLSKYHFHRIFKAFYGCTLNEYIIRIRLEKSAIVLCTSQKTIKDIALEYDFNDLETFIHAFDKYFNTTPSIFREQQRKITLSSLNTIINTNNFKQQPYKEPEIVNIKSIKIACIRHIGHYDTVGPTWEKLIKWGYKKWLLGWKPKMIGIPHDSPQITAEENIRYDACVVIRKEIQPENDIQYKEIVRGQYAVFSYKGSYHQLSNMYNYIYGKWLIESNYTLRDDPGFEMYKNNPKRTKPENLFTEIYIPI